MENNRKPTIDSPEIIDQSGNPVHPNPFRFITERTILEKKFPMSAQETLAELIATARKAEIFTELHHLRGLNGRINRVVDWMMLIERPHLPQTLTDSITQTFDLMDEYAIKIKEGNRGKDLFYYNNRSKQVGASQSVTDSWLPELSHPGSSLIYEIHHLDPNRKIELAQLTAE